MASNWCQTRCVIAGKSIAVLRTVPLHKKFQMYVCVTAGPDARALPFLAMSEEFVKASDIKNKLQSDTTFKHLIGDRDAFIANHAVARCRASACVRPEEFHEKLAYPSSRVNGDRCV